MNTIDRNIVSTYSSLFEGLSTLNKIELIENLAHALKMKTISKDRRFYKSFGAFASKESAENIIKDIKSRRRFRNKETKF